MLDTLEIQSHRGPYSVTFDDGLLSSPASISDGLSHFIVDANIACLYASKLRSILENPNTILVDAREENKSLERTIPVMERLIESKIRRDHTLIAIGGGIIQDITCFIASTLLRGLPWRFVPTTLLAQTDSCIGSKSSINLGATKNVLGTFNPPQRIFICTAFLDTLEARDVHSGVGEILKVNAIAGMEAFDRVASDFDRLFLDRSVLLKYVREALLVKQRYIEQDEFDRGIRNVFNYGHSFGHAIESVTSFVVPHGIAVSMGMDMANYVSVERGLLPAKHYHRMHAVLRRNYEKFSAIRISAIDLVSALMKDKKNSNAMLGLVLPAGEQAVIQRMQVRPDDEFRIQCEKYLAGLEG